MSVRTRRVRNKELLQCTEGVFGRSVDATLSLIAYVTALCITPTTMGKAALKAQLLSEEFLRTVNYEVIKNALITARKKQFIVRHRHAMPEITKEGKKRLQGVLPFYKIQRVWDGRLHAVTYDIPEKKHKARDLLRSYLRKIGCAKLQESVWLTPYNPVDVLRAFITLKDIEGTVIVSDLGRDASVGEETIEELIERLYNLTLLNERYSLWLDEFSENPMNFKAYIQYMAILKDDPQLPFALLPQWWKGDKAYHIIQPILMKLL